MKIVSSYAIEIKHINKLFRQTIKIYNDAISFCVKVFEENWDVLKTLDVGNKERKTYADSLIHSTKSNIAAYPEFDVKFHKMPSYLRFAVINTALGYLSSYHILRGKDADLNTYELCRFSSGKVYNCDLSASYNIGARYFIREAQKSMSVKMWSDIVAKVPECQKRTQCTYATLLEINKVA